MREGATIVTVLAAVLALQALAACGRGPVPCTSATGCPGAECLANRCVTAGSDPVPAGSERLVLEPSAVAVTGGPSGNAAPTVTLGAESHEEALYLTFAPVPEGRRVLTAFLLLETAPGTEPNPADVPLSVWTVVRPLSPARAARGARPRVAPPEARGVARSSPRTTTRIDVTALVASQRERAQGLAVVAASDVDRGVTLLSGNAEGAPRLELYLEPLRRR